MSQQTLLNKNIGWLVGCFFVILLISVASGAGFACGSDWIQLNLGPFQICGGPPPAPSPDVCHDAACVREVAKLVSAEAYLVTDIEYVNRPNLPEPLKKISELVGLEEKFVILANGTVVAGFDLEEIKDDAVWSDGKRIQLHLPPPKILYPPIINHTKIIYHSDKCPDLICTETVQSIDPILAEIQQRMITESIENKDIKLLDRAATSAQKHFEEFFKSLGYEEIRIIIDPYPM
jgi:hypothetical protein